MLRIMTRDPRSTVPASDIDVHVSGRDRSVDGILRLIEIAGQERPLMELLADMCPHIAELAGSDVVTVYVRENERLVMRGNIGFPSGAVGRVSLRVGEGLTGMVAECMRPVSVAVAGDHSSYEHVPGLGEERFPSFVGVPLLGAGRVIGVLVAQRRRAEAFVPAEIALLTALGAPVALAIDQARRRTADSRRGRSARLTGVPLVGGSAMGRVSPIPNLTGLADPAPGESEDLAAAFARLTGDLERASRQLREERDPEVRRALVNLELALADQRFRERLLSARGGLVSALRELARDYARVPYRVPVRGGAIEPAIAERAREIEDLCVLLHAAATQAPLLSPGGVWVGERVGAFVALCAVARGAAAIVCADVVEDGPAVAIARAGGVPLLVQVEGLYAWVRPGDLIVVDADKGSLRLNPTASSVESFRRGRSRR